jgi:hypothetical protein
MSSSTNTYNSQNFNGSSRIRIAAFGHRGVGKSTYLTALYAMLVNNIYRGIDFEYTNDDTAAKLAEYLNAVAENYSNTRDWQLPPTISMPQELHFLLRRKGQDFHLNLIDYRGESTTIGEMTQNKDLLDFFATCDGLMLFNSNEVDEEDQTLRRANHLARHQDLKYLFSRLKNRSGKQKLQIPVAMVYTKSDKIDFGTFSLEDWIENKNSSLMETLRNNVQSFKTIFLSSQMAFLNVMEDDRFRLTETERSGSVVKCDTDVAYPLFWLLDQIQLPNQIQEIAPKTKKTLKWWIFFAFILLAFGLGMTWWVKNNSSQISTIDTNPPLLTPEPYQQTVIRKEPPLEFNENDLTNFTAVIDDPDGFTNVRAGQSNKSEILGQMMIGEPFLVLQTESDWWKVRGKENKLEGFIHKSRIKKQEESSRLSGQYYVGSIGHYPISIYLQDGIPIECDSGGVSILGYYYYDRKGAGNKIRLKGYKCGANVSLYEFDKSENKTAIFEGIEESGIIKGTWRGVKNEFEFFMNKTTSL